MIRSSGRIIRGVEKLIITAMCISSAQINHVLADDKSNDDLYVEALRAIMGGRQEDAVDLLANLVQKEPQHAGAFLDLAIVNCQIGLQAEAERLFELVESRFAPSPEILEVIALYRKQGCHRTLPRQHFSVSISRGTDSNVNQGPLSPLLTIGQGDYIVSLELMPEFLPKRDQFTALSLEYSKTLADNNTTAFSQATFRMNDHVHNYNMNALVAGVEHTWRVANASIKGTGSVLFQTLGGNLYQKQTQVLLRMTPPSPFPASTQFSLIAGAAHNRYPTLVHYDSNTYELRSQIIYRVGNIELQASVGRLNDLCISDRPGGDRYGFTENLQVKFDFQKDIFGTLDFFRQKWKSDAVYFPGLIDVRQSQDIRQVRGGIWFPLDRRQAVALEFNRLISNNNISIFEYTDTIIQATWRWGLNW